MFTFSFWRKLGGKVLHRRVRGDHGGETVKICGKNLNYQNCMLSIAEVQPAFTAASAVNFSSPKVK